MNKNELLKDILGDEKFSNWNCKDAEELLTRTLETIKDVVKRGDEVSLVGFGTFSKVIRSARTGLNPSTGEKISIKEKVVPKFRPSQAFKDYL
ncbi:MAG: HU family DNA-binding protein [Oligoflexia bacterium]|nr:HU family DNA-binding protein [Oligoflexia bacterium]